MGVIQLVKLYRRNVDYLDIAEENVVFITTYANTIACYKIRIAGFTERDRLAPSQNIGLETTVKCDVFYQMLSFSATLKSCSPHHTKHAGKINKHIDKYDKKVMNYDQIQIFR